MCGNEALGVINTVHEAIQLRRQQINLVAGHLGSAVDVFHSSVDSFLDPISHPTHDLDEALK